MPPVRGLRRNIAITLVTEKLEWWITRRKTSWRIGLLILIQYVNVTDGQTSHDGIGRAMHSVARQNCTRLFSCITFLKN